MQITDFGIILLKQIVLSYIMLYVNVDNMCINANNIKYEIKEVFEC